jgi:hypothetical protein
MKLGGAYPTGTLQVRLARAADVATPCCENFAAIIPRPETIHAAELRCTGCGRFRGWLAREALEFLTEATRQFGAPTTPLILRDNSIGDRMLNKQRENSGVLFKNDRKQTESSPDYQGSINVGGTEFYLSAWIKQGQKAKFMSLAVKPKNAEGDRQPAARERAPAMDDEIPF